MGWTKEQVAEIEEIILELAKDPLKSTAINGRHYTKRDLAELTALRDRMLQEINTAAGGHRSYARVRRPSG